MDFLLPLIQGLVDKYPTLATVLLAIGTLRLCVKPAMSALRAYVASTAGTGDDAKLAAFDGNGIVKGLCYVLDLLTSIKIGPSAK